MEMLQSMVAIVIFAFYLYVVKIISNYILVKLDEKFPYINKIPKDDYRKKTLVGIVFFGVLYGMIMIPLMIFV